MSWGGFTRSCYWKQTDLSMLFDFFSLPGIWLGYLPASSLFSLSDSVCCGQSCLARGYAPWLCSGKPVSHMFSVCCVKNVRPLLEQVREAPGWLLKRNAGSQHRHIQQCPLWAVGYSDCQGLPSGLVKVLQTALLCGTQCSIPGLLYSRDVAGHHPLLTWELWRPSDMCYICLSAQQWPLCDAGWSLQGWICFSQ